MFSAKSVEWKLYLGSYHWGLNKMAATLQTRLHFLIIFSDYSFYSLVSLDAGVIGPLSRVAIITFDGQILRNIHTVCKQSSNLRIMNFVGELTWLDLVFKCRSPVTHKLKQWGSINNYMSKISVRCNCSSMAILQTTIDVKAEWVITSRNFVKVWLPIHVPI